MLPDAFDDPAFRGLLDDIAVVLGVVDIDFDAHASTIHRYTFGLRKFVRRIFKQAYRIMRREHQLLGTPMKLTMRHIDAAYDDDKAYGKDRMATGSFLAPRLAMLALLPASTLRQAHGIALPVSRGPTSWWAGTRDSASPRCVPPGDSWGKPASPLPERANLR
ncbi:hypothetical protein QTH90_21085 [Variovorax sp. J2P1-59]|uniref:hypothetical protein n=1 Tax=Variovorax flavidus TaxID=3053501 RepID=UPI00257799E7|nr:hypothetical protein [Variovorax sp. J2P1-59]MDM0076917.1 hypothetical protein [Variovorax sp. J2P1-59]